MNLKTKAIRIVNTTIIPAAIAVLKSAKMEYIIALDFFFKLTQTRSDLQKCAV
jgi:hypothetical protein